jgi:hypothetical protein
LAANVNAVQRMLGAMTLDTEADLFAMIWTLP